MRQSLRIVNVKGLHARASAKLVELVEAHDAEAVVRKDGIEAAGNSIMGLLMLAAAHGSVVEVETAGREAEALGRAIARLVADSFGEGG